MQLLTHLKPLPPLPDSFLFGVSISDHQAEASDNHFPPDIWDAWEKRAGVVPRGRATDFWNRWEEDVLNAHRLGCRAFRFSIAWARVEPQPGKFDQSVLDHYRSIVLRMRELNMEPIVTLCHFVWPQHVEDRGGLRSTQFARWFATYADHVRTALDPNVKYWITFNEPNILLQGFYKLWFQAEYMFPPGNPAEMPLDDQIDGTIAAIRHLFEAHAAARKVLRRINGEHNLVSANVFQLGLPPMMQRLINWNVKRLKRGEDWRDHFWRVMERPTLLGRRFDLIITANETRQFDHGSQLKAAGFDTLDFSAGLTALVKHASPIDTLDKLSGHRLAFVHSAEWEAAAAVQVRLRRERSLSFSTHDEALIALKTDRVEALIADRLVLEALAQLHTEYRVIDQRFSDELYTIAIEMGQPALLQAVQHSLNVLHSKASSIEICRRYFPSAVDEHSQLETEPHTPHFTGLGHIQERGKLIVGVHRSDLPWIDLMNSTRDRVGAEFDLGRLLAGSIFGDTTQVEFRRAALPHPSKAGGRLRNRVNEWLRSWTVFSTFVSSAWWYLGMHGDLPNYLCPPEAVGQIDFVSFDYYFGVSRPTPGQLHRLSLTIERKFNQAALWPGGLYHALRYYHALFPELPIVIAENGFADQPLSDRRGSHIVDHIQAVRHAIGAGIDVCAYCVWSITSNREWGLPQHDASDFGLYYINMDGDPELKRQPTPSVEVYRKLIEHRGEFK